MLRIKARWWYSRIWPVPASPRSTIARIGRAHATICTLRSEPECRPPASHGRAGTAGSLTLAIETRATSGPS